MLCTKAGFLTPDGEMPADPNEYFAREFLDRGVFQPEEIAAGCHCMAPKYLADQMKRSLENFGVESIDVFYLHNPETQLTEVSAPEFRKRIRDAFAFLESAVAERKIGAYGMATWNAFREDPKSPGYLSLEAMAEIASEVGGAQHHFRFVQLPFNLAMPEALTRPNQTVAGKTMPMVQAARDLGITLVTSAALLQGQLTKNLPPFVHSALKLKKESELALAICALGARAYHSPCRHESCRARPGESCASGRRTGVARAIHDAVRVEGLGCGFRMDLNQAQQRDRDNARPARRRLPPSSGRASR